MATRRQSALPRLALAAALGATALATSAAAEQAATRPADSHSTSASANSRGDVTDWNSMVPEGERPGTA